ncbi:FecCD family ABC transporter permease [Entomohabitans teleogrylli]|uniref:FecCD family ABC transporter permease n=1 Tax=Entomohabitans teleogrylli TaxID=1384589 RepID=UPI00073DA57E|nr:iron ABC transporter permease [Entomohabitans teleogrylli]
MSSRRYPATRLTLLAVALLLLGLLAASQGAMRLPLNVAWGAADDSLRHIWWQIRLPRVLLAVLVGGALALSGCVMQGVFRNPLADPGLLGISSGAALAVGIAVVLLPALPATLQLWLPMLAAFAGSLGVTLTIFMLCRRASLSLATLLLMGIAINALAGAALGVLSWISNDQQLRQLSLWGMGSLGQARWAMLAACAALMIPAMLVVLRQAAALNLLQTGDEEAWYLGVNVARVRLWLLTGSALLVAGAVAVSGVIGFIGLVIPHLLRLFGGADHRWLLPGAALAGAMLLLGADTLARTAVAPAEMPVGLLTSLLGGPGFLWLIYRQRRGR